MKKAMIGIARLTLPLFFLVAIAHSQAPKQDLTDPVVLLKAVARTYAAGVDTFHLESITETTQNSELLHERRKVYHTVIKGPGNLYRIETRSPYGSFIQDYDGTNEWVYLIEAKAYVKRPLSPNWPKFQAILSGGSIELWGAWDMRNQLESDAGQYKHATMLPSESIAIEGRSYPCYVVHVTSDDRSRQIKDVHSDTTFWIDKAALVFRKQVEHDDNYLLVTSKVHVPWHTESTTIYPVADLNPHIAPETFRFTPPADAEEVATLEPDFGVPPSNRPKLQMVGQMAPDVTFTGLDGKKVDDVALAGLHSSYCSSVPGKYKTDARHRRRIQKRPSSTEEDCEQCQHDDRFKCRDRAVLRKRSSSTLPLNCFGANH